jgi:phage terminase small subunit
MRRERLALSKLTDKQKLFCEEYIRSFDKVAAMTAGGYYMPKDKRGLGTTQRKLIEKNFENIMKSPTVGEYLHLLKQSVASRLNVSMDQIIDEYKAMAFTNMDDYVSWTNAGFQKVKSSKELTRAQKAGIIEISETTTKSGTTVKIKLHNKQTALDRLFEVLKELEEVELKPEGPAKISQTQINVILQDPVKRRAVEHLAESMFDKQICLVGTDKDRIEFDKHMTKITTKLLEATGGRKFNVGSAVGAEAKQITTGSGEGEDNRNNSSGSKGSMEAAKEVCEVEDANIEEKSDLEAGRRYAVDGI